MLATAAHAQTIEESLSGLTEENAQLYIEPLTGGLGAALNSGFYHTAKVHDPLGFDLGLRLMGAFVPSSMNTFAPVLPESVEYEGITYFDPYGPAAGFDNISPSVSGEGQGLLMVPQGDFRDALIGGGLNPTDYDVRMPRGYDFPVVPYAAVQAALGVPLGTELVLRFIPSFTPDDDVGSISMIGGAVKHSLSQWLPGPSPVDVAAAFGFQTFKVGSYLDANSSQWSLIVSKQLSLVTFYAAGTLENADLEVSYLFVSPIDDVPVTQEIRFSQDTPNKQTLALGGTLQLGGFGLHGEYAFGSYDVVSVSLLFGMN
jgi:hypothetical protein